MHWVPRILAGLIAARMAFGVVRFVLAPIAVKRNYPAALWARFRWRWLTRNLGLSYLDQHRKAVKPVPFGTSVKVPPAQPEAIRLRFPRARIHPDAFGLVATVRTVPKVGRADFENHADHIANAWRCQRVSVSQPRPGRLIVRGMRRDPLLERFGLEAAPPGVYGLSGNVNGGISRQPVRKTGAESGQQNSAPDKPSVSKLWLGRDEHGNDRFANLANCPGIVVGGMPGAGKSIEITGWLTQLVPSPAVQLALLDGKGADEWLDFGPRAYAMAGDDLDQALEVLEAQHALMTERLASVRSVLGVKNAWHVGPTVDWPLVVTVIDECQSYLDLTAVKGDKQLEPKVRRAIFLVSSLIRKGRSVMMLTVPATQKPTTDSLPSSIRDNCPVSLCFGVKTIDAAAATLGTEIRRYESYSPVTLADPAYAGCCTATLKTGQDPFTRLRGPYVSEDQAAEVALASAHLRRDPRAALPITVPDDASELVGG